MYVRTYGEDIYIATYSHIVSYDCSLHSEVLRYGSSRERIFFTKQILTFRDYTVPGTGTIYFTTTDTFSQNMAMILLRVHLKLLKFI